MFWCFNKQSHALMPSWLLLKMQKRWSIIQTANSFTTATNVSTGLFIAYNNNIWQQNVSTIILESYCFVSSSVQARLSSKCLSFMYMPMECQQGQKTSATKQKHFVFVSLPNHWNLSETKTFCFCFTAKSLKPEWNKNILYLFHCQINGHWEKQKHKFLFVCQ